MNPPLCYSSGCMTGYGFVCGVRKEFTDNSEYGIAALENIGVIDAPDSMPGGGMRFADNGLGKVQVQTWRGS